MGNQSSAPKLLLAPDAPEGAKVLAHLLEENDKFTRGQTKKLQDVSSIRTHLAKEGQTPVACVIACADSRVSPEILFRAHLGELFVIRTAGNTTWGPEVEGSLEYAVNHLNIPLVLILGHTKCGAVGAACSGGDPLPGQLGTLITTISKGIKAQGGIPENLDTAVEHNVRNCVWSLRKDAMGNIPMAEKRGVVVCGAVYNIETGKVNVLDNCFDHAHQEEKHQVQKSHELHHHKVDITHTCDHKHEHTHNHAPVVA